MLPKLIAEVKIKEWLPKIKSHKCYLYDLETLGVTPEQFADVIAGSQAYLFEKPFTTFLRASRCAWCEYNDRNEKRIGKRKGVRWKGATLQDHVYTHNKNIVDFQINKFQQELYSLRLGLVRKGFHAALNFLVEHECQLCLNPIAEGREGKCAIPTSPRNRVRSLKTLGYPIKHLKKLRTEEWSALGVIVLNKV